LLEIVVELARSITAFRANIHGIPDAVCLLAEIKLYALVVSDRRKSNIFVVKEIKRKLKE
jgi:hypothetical protein